MEYDISKLYAVPYNKLSTVSRVINKNTLPYFFWIKIPNIYTRQFELYQIQELTDALKNLDFDNFVQREPCKPWIRINSGILNLDIGMHTYKLCFVNRYTNDVVDLYICYTIQSDNPTKSYVYINKYGV